MSKNFNMLELVGAAHLLTEEQKIIKFRLIIASQLISTIKAAKTNFESSHPAHGQNNFNSSGPPHLIGGSVSGTNDITNSVQVGNSFRWPGKRYLSTSNSPISSVTLNGKSYHDPIFVKRGNMLN